MQLPRITPTVRHASLRTFIKNVNGGLTQADTHEAPLELQLATFESSANHFVASLEEMVKMLEWDKKYLSANVYS